ncbi:hypothetical protein LAZ67_1004890 [Cordylochernes scorpioides]|uniref:Uncharacterized protein n=1 Tax=Cordylochernes scorpioides TaxID=51811 RepID=A0ABY6JZH9_9ARAC|nr:hypothetical protein LAZ67_1004890 [Cordylochernes scorpioides]
MSLQGSAPKVKPLRIYPRKTIFKVKIREWLTQAPTMQNLPIDRSHANFAAACIADVTPSTSGALAAATNWAEQMEAAESVTEEHGKVSDEIEEGRAANMSPKKTTVVTSAEKAMTIFLKRT